MTISNIEIVGIPDSEVRQRIQNQMNTLFLSRKRTIPGSRGFGLEGTFVDMPPLEAVTRFALELDEAVSSALPVIRVRKVEPIHGDNGESAIRVFVEMVET